VGVGGDGVGVGVLGLGSSVGGVEEGDAEEGGGATFSGAVEGVEEGVEVVVVALEGRGRHRLFKERLRGGRGRGSARTSTG
jgi:hypothetical protein